MTDCQITADGYHQSLPPVDSYNLYGEAFSDILDVFTRIIVSKKRVNTISVWGKSRFRYIYSFAF